MIGGLVTGNIAVGQFQDAATLVSLRDAILYRQQAVAAYELAIVLRVARFRWYFVAVLGRSWYIRYFDLMSRNIPFSMRYFSFISISFLNVY